VNNVDVNGDLSAGDLSLFGSTVNINGATASATGSVSVLADALNIVAGTMPAQLIAGTDLGISAGQILLQGGSGTDAFAELRGGTGTFDVFTIASGTTSGNIILNGGSGSGAYARIFGDPDVGSLLLPVSVGGVILMSDGTGSGAYARIESASANSIYVDFTNVTSGSGYFINDVDGTVSSGSTGFFAGGQPAIPDQNLIVTYNGFSGIVPDILPPSVQDATNQVVALTNQQFGLPGSGSGESDGATGGSSGGQAQEEKQKKQLPICSR